MRKPVDRNNEVQEQSKNRKNNYRLDELSHSDSAGSERGYLTFSGEPADSKNGAEENRHWHPEYCRGGEQVENHLEEYPQRNRVANQESGELYNMIYKNNERNYSKPGKGVWNQFPYDVSFKYFHSPPRRIITERDNESKG